MSKEQQRRARLACPGANIANQVARAAIATLKRQRFGMSGVGPGSLSARQEFALQVQAERSAFWDDYVIHVLQVIEGAVVVRSEADQHLLALCTPDGRAWAEAEQAERDSEPPRCLDAMAAVAYGSVLRAAMDDDDVDVARLQSQPCERLNDDCGAATGAAAG